MITLAVTAAFAMIANVRGDSPLLWAIVAFVCCVAGGFVGAGSVGGGILAGVLYAGYSHFYG